MSHDPLLCAVVTGDVVASTALSRTDRAALPAFVRSAFGEIRQARNDALPVDVDVFGGDSWQAYTRQPDVGLTVALYLRARLRERFDVEVRAALSIDTIDFLQPASVSESDGRAFRRSGRALEQLDRNELFRLVLPEHLADVDVYAIAAEGIADAVDSIAQKWTPAQAQAVSHMLRGYPDEPRQQHVSEAWRPAPISQPAVNKNLKKAGWEWIARALGRYARLTEILTHAHLARQASSSDDAGAHPSEP